MAIKQINIKLEKIGNSKEWFLIVDKDGSQERGWLIGRKKEVEKIIKQLMDL